MSNDAENRSPASPAPWPRHALRDGHDYRIFRTRFEELENPRTGQRMERVVIDAPEWVNIVARTEAGELVVIEQFRFGTGSVTVEVPGGMVDPGEDPLDAARRELREETGYVSDHWTSLGWVEPNPAIQSNRCHHFLADRARRTEQQDLDAGEDIVVGTMTPDEVRRAIDDGRMRHALVLTAVARVLDLRAGAG